MSDRCGQELCADWTGDGCACAVFGLEGTCEPCVAGMHEQCPKLSGCCGDVRVGGYSGTEHR